MKAEVRGRIHTVAEAPVLNLSAAGALLEVPCALRVGATYSVRLAVAASPNLEIKARVVRSYVHGFDKNDRGETVVKYRAAVEFGSLPDEQKGCLQEFLRGLENVGTLRAELLGEREL